MRGEEGKADKLMSALTVLFGNTDAITHVEERELTDGTVTGDVFSTDRLHFTEEDTVVREKRAVMMVMMVMMVVMCGV